MCFFLFFASFQMLLMVQLKNSKFSLCFFRSPFPEIWSRCLGSGGGMAGGYEVAPGPKFQPPGEVSCCELYREIFPKIQRGKMPMLSTPLGAIEGPRFEEELGSSPVSQNPGQDMEPSGKRDPWCAMLGKVGGREKKHAEKRIEARFHWGIGLGNCWIKGGKPPNTQPPSKKRELPPPVGFPDSRMGGGPRFNPPIVSDEEEEGKPKKESAYPREDPSFPPGGFIVVRCGKFG